MTGEKSEGQRLVEQIEEWLSSWMYFPSEHYGLVAALWAINTWVFRDFDAVPYLAITAATKRAGKTTLLELLAMLSQNAEMVGAGTPATTFRLIRQHGGTCSLFFDEAERVSKKTADMMGTLMNTGYRRGQEVPRTNKWGTVEKYPVYCPKAFSLIGDPNDTLRDRSILFVLTRGRAQRPYRHSVAACEAQAIVQNIEDYLASGGVADLPVVLPDWLDSRDQELWTPLVSLAHAMPLDAATIERLQRASADLSAAKTAPLRRAGTGLRDEERAMDSDYAERALAALVSVLDAPDKTHTGDIWSAVAVERMKAIPTGPWRTYRGVGLDVVTLAGLVQVFGVTTNGNVRMVRGRDGVVKKGYSGKNVRASASAIAVRSDIQRSAVKAPAAKSAREKSAVRASRAEKGRLLF